MWVFEIRGIDENGLAYSYMNETLNWTMRGVRKNSQCFGVVETYLCEPESRPNDIVHYSWNPIDGYVSDPLGHIKAFYS